MLWKLYSLVEIKIKEEFVWVTKRAMKHQRTETQTLSRDRQQAWLAKIRRVDIVPKQYYNIWVCSDHFLSGSTSALYDVANPNCAQSLKLVFELLVKQTSIQGQKDMREQWRRRVVDEDVSDGPNVLFTEESNVAKDNKSELDNTRDLL